MSEERDVVIFKRSRGKDGLEKHGIGDEIDGNFYWKESTPGTEVQGDANANGTSICTLSITAAKIFLCKVIMASAYPGAILRIGTGTLGSMTDILPLDLIDGGGLLGAAPPNVNFFEVDNSGGSSALTLRMYAPQTAKGSASNNSTGHYFDGFIGGFEY